ncbi:MAG: 5'/3'-nucleotidase SurE [Halioglobus sp.]|nr:5'/3'-nucleotidase SurE [Halioglobus sp.]
MKFNFPPPIIYLSIAMLVGCSGGSDKIAAPALPQTLTILVTNDDGIGAPGIDALVTGLLQLDDVNVELVAPAENQSGSSDKTTIGHLISEDSTTVSGYKGIAVYGYPADAVNVALEDVGIIPHLVVSGVNAGQNVGPFAALSGTVGAARTAAIAGYPAVAVSASPFTEYVDYNAAVGLVTDWVKDNRDVLLGGSANVDTVTSFNIPGCTQGVARRLVNVPLAESIPEGHGSRLFKTNCSLQPEGPPTTDVDAMVKGHAAVTDVPLQL